MDAHRGRRHFLAGRAPPVEQLVLGRRHLQIDARVVPVRGRRAAGGRRGGGRVEAPGPLPRAGGHAQRGRRQVPAATARRPLFARVLVPLGAAQLDLVERHRPHLFGNFQTGLRLHLGARRRPRPFERRTQAVHDRLDVGRGAYTQHVFVDKNTKKKKKHAIRIVIETKRIPFTEKIHIKRTIFEKEEFEQLAERQLSLILREPAQCAIITP